MSKRLLPLTLATFAVGTDSYVIAGLLPAIAADLQVSTPAAGQLVTVFALVMALSAPVMGALTSGLDRRTALLIALSVFVVGNAVTALGTSYEVVMIARIVTAVGAGMINPAASSTAGAIAPPKRRGGALAFVLGGLTLATALGLPLGTPIGRTDWHITLWAVAGIGPGRHRRAPTAPTHRPQPGRSTGSARPNSSAIYVGIALGGGLGGLAQEWFAIVPAGLGLPAAGVTTLALLYHLTTARHRAPATPQPTPSTSERAEA